ncbi:hypothetical protein P168DRAFT_278027 [Aspergillus campestris IBT 28561]|uniref:Uncharacterized protein n=1 Tax=Aspergillus campestris (strain IBT 28561) TaxID=1392248 RepID=A0A2I1DF04_ASPC2|nr:uncharacterized protein P168DRAFT_278027 [Aspergillus campestris IBT 28561]PKY08438.1 hypothetical protein P168DRAFT_278027 [Aspergillus campestris IBT 28561]
MFTSSSSIESTSSSSGSPISQHAPTQVWPTIPRRRPVEQHKYQQRYYSTPMRNDSPDSTPLHMYGLEQREPSIMERPANNKLLRRFSHALDDIKEDLTLQIDSRATADRSRTKRRQSSVMFDGTGSERASSAGSFTEDTPQPPFGRPKSILSLEAWTPPARRFSRRLSMFRFTSQRRKFEPGQGASISQPNLIGASTQI